MPVVCPFKLLTGLPCPSCGATRAVIHLLRGDVRDAFLTNPVGPLVVVAALGAVGVVVRDLVRGEAMAPHLWRRLEAGLRQPMIASAGLTAIAANWIWNITKGL